MIQTVDFFTPIVNDPFRFGQIAAANALSDVYAMGGEPYAAMNIVCFPVKCMPLDILKDVLRGGLSKIAESGAAMAGGHSVDDQELKYGLSVSGLADPGRFASNRGLKPGDRLLLTKPIGTGVLATAVKGRHADSVRLEEIIWKVASRLNNAPGRVVRELGLSAATDVTGFGLGGHALEMSRASGLAVVLAAQDIPYIPEALELARIGFIPGGSHANRRYFAGSVDAGSSVDSIFSDLIFDAQTSGGMLLAVPSDKVDEASAMLCEAGDMAREVGFVTAETAPEGLLRIR